MKPDSATANQAFVLVFCLVLILAISLVMLSQMRSALLHSKTLVLIQRQTLDFYQFEGLLERQRQDALWQNGRCMASSQDPNAVLLAATWLNSCLLHQEGKAYYYLVQDLGIESCLRIATATELLPSHHWLLNLLDTKGRILQWRIAEPEWTKRDCNRRSQRSIKAGLLSWRLCQLQGPDLKPSSNTIA